VGPSGPRGRAAASCRIKLLITNDQSANICRPYLNSPTSLRLFTSDILASGPRLSTIELVLSLDFNFSYGIIRAHFCIIGIAQEYAYINEKPKLLVLQVPQNHIVVILKVPEFF